MYVVISRFICCVTLHMALGDELKQGFDCMKYALNHPWRFSNWRLAFTAGLMQSSSVMLNEFVNILTILYSTNIMSVVMNFLALVVISDFDDMFYGALRNESWKEFLSDSDTYGELLMIERTSSHRAAHDHEEHILDDDAIDITDEKLLERLKNSGDLPKCIYQSFWDRLFFNKLAFIIYRVMRAIYVSVWFYFLPFVILFASYYVPFFLQMYDEK